MFSMPIYSINDNKEFFTQILQKGTQKRLLFIQNTGYLMVVSNATILTLVETSQAFFKTSEKFVDSPIVQFHIECHQFQSRESNFICAHFIQIGCYLLC